MPVPHEKYFTALCNSLGDGESTQLNVAFSFHTPNINTINLPASAMTVDAKYTPVSHPVSIPRYTPSMQEKIHPTRELLIKRIKERRMSPMPNCIKNKAYAEIYIAFVNNTFFHWVSDDRKTTIIQAMSSISNPNWTLKQIQNCENIISMAVKHLNTTRILAALIIGDVIGMSPENCFCRFPQNKSDNLEICGDVTCGTLPKILVSGDTVFKLERIYPIRGVGGRVLQVVCRYMDGTESATVYLESFMQVGKTTLTAYLPAADLIDTMPDATVHLCLCPDVLWDYLYLAREGKLAHRAGIVVTGCFGGLSDFNALDLTPIAFHPVALICSPDRPEWEKLEYMAKRCIDHGASSVTLYPWPLIA